MPTVYEQILLRRGTSTEWASVNTVLGAAEIGVETDTGRFKLGDGTTAWVNLAYKSDRGLPGLPGPAGAQGPAGSAGPAGPRGAAGPAAALTIGSVSQGSTPSATITGTAENPILNLVLPQGATGATGAATSITIGTVSSGTTPSATFTGTAPNLTLNLVLPKGDTGSQGPQGAQGVAGPTGPQGPQGERGGAGIIKGQFTTWPPVASGMAVGDIWIFMGTTVPATAPTATAVGDGFVYTGATGTTATLKDGWLDIGPLRGPAGPQGATGATGAQGAQGAQGNVGPQGPAGSQGPAGPTPTMTIGTVTTGAAASASITGTAPNFVLNLVLPSAAASQQSTVFTQHPASTTATSGASVTFTALAVSTETPIVYGWEKQAAGSSSWSALGSTTTSLTITASAGDNGAKYRAKATTATVGTVYSLPATLTVSTAPPANGTAWSLASGVVDYTPGVVAGQTVSKTGTVAFASDLTALLSQNTFTTGFSYSPDGIAWTACAKPIPNWSNHPRIIRHPGFFVAIGDTGTANRPNSTTPTLAGFTSFDGNTWDWWSPQNASTGYLPEAMSSYATGVISSANRILMAPVRPYWSIRPTSQDSGDLWWTDWSAGFKIAVLTTNLGQSWAGSQIRFANGVWFARLTDGFLYRSTNGTTWTKAQRGGVDFSFGSASAAPFDVAYANGYYILVTEGTLAYKSTDGSSWTSYGIGPTAFWRGVTFGNSVFIALDGASTCATSADGQTWTVLNNMPLNAEYAPAWSSLAFGNGRFVSCGASAYTGRGQVAVNNLCYTG